MEKNNITYIDFLKIDAQGSDLDVVKSLGKNIKNVKQIYLEVQITDFEVYKNSSKKYEILEYMNNHNFKLKKVERQSYNQEENLLFENQNQLVK